jgi:hypothetical protein
MIVNVVLMHVAARFLFVNNYDMYWILDMQ